MKTVILYTDGACSGNPGPGGWGCILRLGDKEKEFSGGEGQTTNNRMELTAVIKGLEALKEPCIVELYSDSKYITDALDKGWAQKWRAQGWMRTKKDPALNPDLWERLLDLCREHTVCPHWVKGHSDNEYNNRCDALAVAATPRKEGTRKNMSVYCDNAATSPICKPALDAMLPWLTENYGNASGFYKIGFDAKKALIAARERVASCLGVEPGTIYFTSGGTESNNWALKGGSVPLHPASAVSGTGGLGHIIVSAIEHHSILNTAEYLQSKGHELTVVPAGKDGLVDSGALIKALCPDTAVVSVIYANNEIGTIQPVSELAKAVKETNVKVLFHTDAVQAAGHIPVEITPEIDMLSFSSHKLGGPKGVGALYIKKGLKLPPLLHGGGHERGRRSSTENIAGIVGFSVALEHMCQNREAYYSHVARLRNQLISGILDTVPYSRLTGHPEHRLPGNASFIFAAVEGECLVMRLDYLGVAASSGSACSTANLDPSHVLLATGLSHVEAHGSLRLTVSHQNTKEEMDFVIQQVKAAVEHCRKASTEWKDGAPTIESGWEA
jgi:cysteine desulfurase